MLPSAAASGMGADLLIAGAPLIALFTVKKLLQSLGVGDITTLSGALGLPTAAAIKVAGEHGLAANVGPSIANTGRSALSAATKIAGPTFAAAGMATGATALAAAGVMSRTDRGQQLLATTTNRLNNKRTQLATWLQQPGVQNVRQLAGSWGQALTVATRGRSSLGRQLTKLERVTNPSRILATVGGTIDGRPARYANQLTDKQTARLVARHDRDGQLAGNDRLGQRLARAVHTSPDPRAAQQHLQAILDGDYRATVGTATPLLVDDHQRDQAVDAFCDRWALDNSDDVRQRLIVGRTGAVTFDPRHRSWWQQQGRDDIADLQPVVAYDQLDGNHPARRTLDRALDDPDLYLETETLITAASGGHRSPTGQVIATRSIDGTAAARHISPTVANAIERLAHSRHQQRQTLAGYATNLATSTVDHGRETIINIARHSPGDLEQLTEQLTRTIPDVFSEGDVAQRIEQQLRPQLDAIANRIGEATIASAMADMHTQTIQYDVDESHLEQLHTQALEAVDRTVEQVNETIEAAIAQAHAGHLENAAAEVRQLVAQLEDVRGRTTAQLQQSTSSYLAAIEQQQADQERRQQYHRSKQIVPARQLVDLQRRMARIHDELKDTSS